MKARTSLIFQRVNLSPRRTGLRNGASLATGSSLAHRHRAALYAENFGDLVNVEKGVRESNPRLPTRQAGTLATELTRHAIHPVTGSGAAQSLRPISTLEA